ncbi:hypothetical protein LSM04_009608 [Trypanosoma melophagium]|uniref:uncharacterized protein n=1 Tax=Trypanosoma melophagium TaxID=715481 RepID=UPI003519EF6C|nr:hypothetical protein LSM04_009608 [Trypanosoma melophagium]
MNLHAKRANPGVPIIEEGLVCDYCSSTKIFLTSASRVGHCRKCAEYQRITHSYPTNLVDISHHQRQQQSNDDASPGPQETLPHMLWECPRLRDISVATFASDPNKLTAPFGTKLFFGFLNNAITLLSTDCHRE